MKKIFLFALLMLSAGMISAADGGDAARDREDADTIEQYKRSGNASALVSYLQKTYLNPGNRIVGGQPATEENKEQVLSYATRALGVLAEASFVGQSDRSTQLFGNVAKFFLTLKSQGESGWLTREQKAAKLEADKKIWAQQRKEQAEADAAAAAAQAAAEAERRKRQEEGDSYADDSWF